MAEEQSVKVQVRGFEDPLVGYVSFEAFEDPLVGLEKLRERPVYGRMGSVPEENTLKASKFDGFPGTMTVRLPKEGSLVTKLLGTFDPERPMRLEAFKEDSGFRLVVNHEEQ
jgi:hypothetical protein